MSGLFRNLGGQGASSQRSNTQYWADQLASEDVKKTRADIEAKLKRGETLTTAEQNQKTIYDDMEAKARDQGVESSKTVSASTGVPDLTDQVVRARRMAQTLQLMSGRGRKASFLNGDYGSSDLGGGGMLS